VEAVAQPLCLELDWTPARQDQAEDRCNTNVSLDLEAMTKETDGGLLMAESTRSRLSGAAESLLPSGELALRGRAESVKVWTLPLGGDGRPREAEAAGALFQVAST